MGRSRFGVRITAALALSGLALVNAQSPEEQLQGLQQQCNAMIGERDQVGSLDAFVTLRCASCLTTTFSLPYSAT